MDEWLGGEKVVRAGYVPIEGRFPIYTASDPRSSRMLLTQIPLEAFSLDKGTAHADRQDTASLTHRGMVDLYDVLALPYQRIQSSSVTSALTSSSTHAKLSELMIKLLGRVLRNLWRADMTWTV